MITETNMNLFTFQAVAAIYRRISVVLCFLKMKTALIKNLQTKWKEKKHSFQTWNAKGVWCWKKTFEIHDDLANSL